MSIRMVLLPCLVVVASACAPGREGSPVAPSPTFESPAPPPAPPGPTPRPISVGEQITDALTAHGTEKLFDLTVPSDGTLVIRLTWAPDRGRLELWVGDMAWTGAGVIAAAIPATNREQYRLSVADGAPWDYGDFFVPFVFTTSIEKASR